MERKIYFLILGLCALFHSAIATEHDQIQKQFIEYFTSSYKTDDIVKNLLLEMKSDGTWSDIDYNSQQRGGWPTLTHLKQLALMATSYAQPTSMFYKSPKMLKSILQGIDYWLDKDYQNPNWWQVEIGIPENMLITFILLGDDLPQEILERAQNSVLKRTKMGMTGQNKVWLAGIAFMKGYLDNDSKLMKSSSDSIWSELIVSTNEGIQPDWSFHQHGPQQQFGNYGLSFGERMVMWGSILRGTSFSLSDDKLYILRQYQLNGPTWISWKGKMDLVGCGRQITAGCQTKKFKQLSNQLKILELIDPEHENEYKEALYTSENRIGHRSFWRSEMAVQREKNWYASVKMSSTRVIGSETVNSENVLGLHLGDGMLLTYINGKEYENITPLWDWHRLPGTTCDQGLNNLKPKGCKNSYGGSAFSGVLGDDYSGLASMIYKRNKISAHKSYFFTSNGIVCLGSGIDGESKGPVYTSVQQSLVDGDVITSEGPLDKNHNVFNKGSWIYHRGIGYQLLCDNAYSDINIVNGNWQSCFTALESKPVTGKVFSIWIDHGRSPKNQTYEYKIYPNSTAETMDQLIKNSKTKIISNTGNIQSIEENGVVYAVFYNAGKLVINKDKVIEVDVPCLLMLKENKIMVSDPIQQSVSLNIKINGRNKKIEFPKGDNAGNCTIVYM